MSNFVKIILLVVVAVVIICSIFVAEGIGEDIAISRLYPMTAIIVHTSTYTDTVTVKDFNGNLWQFKGVEDYEVGDIVSLIMNDKGTEKIFDDEIIKAQYDGYLKGWEALN